MSVQFWKNKRVFITGHTGFKGGWLSLWLQEMGAIVSGYALDPTTERNLFTIARIEENMSSVIGDIRDHELLNSVVASFKPDIIFHLAAQPLVRLSYADPIGTYATNVLGTVHLLEAIRHLNCVRAVVNITSDKCYENKEWHWGYRESDRLGGYDPYSSSKACAELVTAAYRQSYFNPDNYNQHGCAVATVRAGNVIGGGDWATDRLIPDVLAAFETENILDIRSPGAIRPWQHALEPLSGYLSLAEKLYDFGPKYMGPWNFGPRDEEAKTVRWVVEYLLAAWGESKCTVDFAQQPPQHHEAIYLKLDCSKANDLLAWQSIRSLPDTLDSIIKWHKAYLEGEDMKTYCLSEITTYRKQRDQYDQ
jgi:CDP-glucose 4,6-dehydratase